MCGKFKNNPNVLLHLKSSTTMLDDIKDINEPITFWLDGHWSFGKTSYKEMYCPVLLELNAIERHHIKTHTILVDDVRLFGTSEFNFISLSTVKETILRINPKYKFSFADGHIPNDILVATVENS